ncbi:MAG: HD domain-containing protein [Candidatus Sericytochromatia bacterium]|nr:HD domain-containing protein [Candidatus Sericytochromatia bacterium]
MFQLPYKFRDVVHDFVEFPNSALGATAIKIVQTSTFQRLRRLSQLGMAKLIYPCAEHSRFAHSLGAFNLAQKVMCILREKGKLLDTTQAEQDAVCLAALMHDIGHCMFSHASETMWDFKHEAQTYKLIDKDEELNKILKEYPSSSDFKKLIVDILKGENLSHNKYFLHEVVSSQMDVDRMDYILRDAHMTGVQYGSYDLKWILEHLTVAEFNGRYRLVIEKKAIDAVEQYLTARFYMYRNVYEHKTARIFEVMLQAFIKEIKKLDNEPLEKYGLLWLKGPDFDNLEEYKLLDDYKMWEAMKIISSNDEFVGHVKNLASDFLFNNRWSIEKSDTKTNVINKGFIDDVYYTKVKPSKFYDQEPDNQVLVLAKGEEPKLLSQLGRFISINKKREVEEKFIIRRPKPE